MTRNIFRKVLAVFAAVLITSAFTNSTLAQHTPSNSGGGRLAGTWDVRVTVRNCQTGAEITSFDSITQFMSGGTVLDSTSAIPQGLKTPGQGTWKHVRKNLYDFNFKAFHFDVGGNYIEYRIVNHEAELDSSGDSYSSSGTVRFFSPDGTLVRTGCSSSTATRFDS